MLNVIEPSTFDLIVVDTGLPLCIVAAAAALNGHSVLHVDPCDFYGSHWTSLPLNDFKNWCTCAGQLPIPSETQTSPAGSPYQTQTSPDSQTRNLDQKSHSDIKHCCLNDELEFKDYTPGQNVHGNVESKESTRSTDLQIKDLSTMVDNLIVPIEDNKDETQDENVLENLESKDLTDLKSQDLLGNIDTSTVVNNKKDKGQNMDAGNKQDHADKNSENKQQTNNDDMVMADMGLEAIATDASSSVYSKFNFLPNSAEDLGSSRNFSIDLAGPKLLFCGGRLVDLLIKSGASNYLEFKGLEASFMWNTEGLLHVPSSRADIFKDRSLGNAEKRYLMRFFKLVVDYSSGTQPSQISEQDLKSPFVEFLQRQQLPSSVQSIILYAITLANHQQDSTFPDSTSLVSTRDGLQSLALYLSSAGRFPNASGAFLYPLYGQGELPQAFSRCAAVKGALYVLRMPVDAVLRDKESHEFRGLRMSTGQLVFSKKLVTGPILYPSIVKAFPCKLGKMHGQDGSLSQGKFLKVVRGVCITNKSLKQDMSTLMVVFPPASLTAKTTGVIRVLQLGSSACVCPEGKFVVQLSMACCNESIGIESLQAATRVLFHCPDFSEESKSEVVEDKPTLLWAAFYGQFSPFPESFECISARQVVVSGMPDETIDYRSVVESAEKIFQELYPDDAFFPKNVPLETDVSGADDGFGDDVDDPQN